MDLILKHSLARMCFLIFTAIIFTPHCATASSPESFSYSLSSSPLRVIKGLTLDVRMTCKRNLSVKSKLEEIESIRIEKRIGSGRWETVAQIADYSGGVDADGHVNATGWLDSTNAEAFLEITWPVASQKTFGLYKCEIVGLDTYLYHEEEATSEMEIQEGNITGADMYNFIAEMKRDMITKVSANGNRLQRLKEDKTRKISIGLGSDYVVMDTLIAWPAGYYGLPQPQSGCPVDLAFYGGDTGYVSVEIEPVMDDYYHQFRLGGPIVDKPDKETFFSLHFCVVTRVFSAAQWPDGKYCIHQKGDVCPQTFQSENLSGDFDNAISNTSIIGGALPEVNPNLLCCKDSGSPQTPMALPTETPFYLYRFGDACQQVERMNVVREDIEIQPYNLDASVTLGLCYYNVKK